MKLPCLITILTTCSISTFAQTGEEILAEMDNNRDHKTVVAQATMTIHIGDEVRTKSMHIKSITGGNKSIVEFTNPEDKGTKYLMLDDNLWIYFPEENDVVKISGHMLKEGMMGSDVSYEDALEADKLSEKYEITLAGKDEVKGRQCFRIELKARGKDAPYYRRTMWVDTVDYVAWKEEMYAKSGKLLKQADVLEVQTIGERTVSVKTRMTNKLRKNSATVFEMTDIALDAPVDEKEFTMRYLRR